MTYDPNDEEQRKRTVAYSSVGTSSGGSGGSATCTVKAVLDPLILDQALHEFVDRGIQVSLPLFSPLYTWRIEAALRDPKVKKKLVALLKEELL